MFTMHHPMKHYSNTIDNSTKKGTLILAASQIQMKNKLNNLSISKNHNGNTIALKTVEQQQEQKGDGGAQGNNYINNDNGNNGNGNLS